MGEFFGKFGEGLRGCPKSNIDGRKLWGNFLKKFGEGWRGFPKSNVGGRKLWGIFSRNLERVCVDFQKTISAGGDHGGFFLELWRG